MVYKLGRNFYDPDFFRSHQVKIEFKRVPSSSGFPAALHSDEDEADELLADIDVDDLGQADSLSQNTEEWAPQILNLLVCFSSILC